jgi:hypothetical protein
LSYPLSLSSMRPQSDSICHTLSSALNRPPCSIRVKNWTGSRHHRLGTWMGRLVDSLMDSAIPSSRKMALYAPCIAVPSSCSHCMSRACSMLRARINVSQTGWSRSNLPLQAAFLFDKFHSDKSSEYVLLQALDYLALLPHFHPHLPIHVNKSS